MPEPSSAGAHSWLAVSRITPFTLGCSSFRPRKSRVGCLGISRSNQADARLRKDAFRQVAKRITGGKAERSKYGFNSDTNGEIARAMEWAFKAGQRAARKS